MKKLPRRKPRWPIAAAIVLVGIAAAALYVWIAGSGSGDLGGSKPDVVVRKETSVPPRPVPLPVPPNVRTQAGSTRANPKDGLTYVWLLAGTFTMGCSASEGDCLDAEKPAHRVNIGKGFWIGQTEVTQAAYERVTGQNPSHVKGAALPVDTVDWDEAQSYCQAAGMRLPSEAEWEYAARGGVAPGSYGPIDGVAWYSKNSLGRTHEVAQKQPNGYGLYDMLGNVWEWVADWFDSGYYGSSPANDPHGPPVRQQRCLRGGSWNLSPGFVRVSFRFSYPPGQHAAVTGVRCVGNDLPTR